MIKKSPPYPIEEERILTKAPELLAAYERSRKTADPEVIVQADPNAKPLFLNTETGTYTDIDGNPSDGKTLEDLMEYDLGDKNVAWSAILSLIAVFALGLIAAGGILLALYNCVAHP